MRCAGARAAYEGPILCKEKANIKDRVWIKFGVWYDFLGAFAPDSQGAGVRSI